jgi:predicted dehydrogenase
LNYDMWVGPARWLPYNVKHTHGAFRWLIDFGGGQIRDRGAHVMSIANWIMDCDQTGPVSVEAKGEPPRDGMYDSAVTMDVTYEFKNPDWTLVWAQPGIPSKELEARYGAVYHGENGTLTVTLGDGAGTSTEQKAKDYAAKCDCGKAFRSPGHAENFEDFQLQRKLEWDAVNERFRNDDEANRMLSRPGRGPWHL